MPRPLFLYTSIHTGTIFTRLSLGLHPLVDVCLMENARIPADLDESKGVEHPAFGPSRGDHELTFGSFITRWLKKEISLPELIKIRDYWNTRNIVGSNQIKTTYQKTVNKEVAMRRRMGYPAAAAKSREPRFFFHEHIRRGHSGLDYTALNNVDTLTTLRHPMLILISVLRRTCKDRQYWEAITALEYFCFVPNVTYFPVDIKTKETVENVLEDIGLPLHKKVVESLSSGKPVNATTTTKQVHQHMERNKTSEGVELRRARQMLIEENKVHPMLSRYWKHFLSLKVRRTYEALGYDFSGH